VPENPKPYAAAIRKLLNGVVYHDDAVWSQLRDYQTLVQDYLAEIGLRLYLDELGGFAFLHDQSRDEDMPGALPALTNRRSLTFWDTLLLVLLRERLDEHEVRDLDGQRLLLREDDLVDMLKVFPVNQRDARTLEQSALASIARLKKYGFLTERNGFYEVRPVIRARVSADELEGIKQRLMQYVQQDETTDNTHEQDT
jgi:hypothetical protein